LLVSASPVAFAQYKSESEASIPLDKFYIERKGAGIRKFISRFTFGLSTGYGKGAIKHKLTDYGILQNPKEPPRLQTVPDPTDPASPVTYYSSWINNSSEISTAPAAGSFTALPKDGKIGFKSKVFEIPLKATIHYEFLNRYRIGGGYSYEYTHIGSFNPISFKDKISGFSSPVSSIWMKHYFGMVGASVYRYYEYLLVVDANIGGYKMGSSFSNVNRGIYFNLGATVERDMSEYFKVFVRPSYEIKTFKLAMQDGPVMKHHFNSFYINIGATYRFPELRRCPLNECHAQLNHAHGNREYRSRRHPIYKKQNPHYGENYPVIIKYKGKNKRKLNPY
jgi:hypothetical protein